VRDLLLWANNFADVRVGTPALLAQMQTATALAGGQRTENGMGFGIGNYRGARTLRTSGGDVGVATELVLYPDKKLAIAVLCNMDSVVMGGLATVNVTELTNGVADAFFDDVLEPRPAQSASGSPSVDAAPPPPVSLSADELARKTGHYRIGSDENHIVSIAVRDGKLALRDFYGDNYDMLMTPISPNRFLIPGGQLEFAPAEAGRPQAWHIVDGDGRRLLEFPLMKYAVSKADLTSYVGEYKSDELDVTYTVSVRDSALVLQSSTLGPVFKDAFVGDYMGTVRFVRGARGAISAFTLNRSGAWGLRFERVKRAD
jgi:hypothetical protein